MRPASLEIPEIHAFPGAPAAWSPMRSALQFAGRWL